jgi:hypothetical protein
LVVRVGTAGRTGRVGRGRTRPKITEPSPLRHMSLAA